MKATGKIKILDATRSGVSQTTGNPWKSKEVVIECTEMGDDGKERSHNLFFNTFNDSCVATLEQCQLGDIIEVDFYGKVNGREITRKDGTQGLIRSQELNLLSITKK